MKPSFILRPADPTDPLNGPRYAGELVDSPANGVVWKCEHEHVTSATAFQCAERELQSRCKDARIAELENEVAEWLNKCHELQRTIDGYEAQDRFKAATSGDGFGGHR